MLAVVFTNKYYYSSLKCDCGKAAPRPCLHYRIRVYPESISNPVAAASSAGFLFYYRVYKQSLSQWLSSAVHI